MRDKLHNTRLLLHRLGDLQSHVEDSVWNAQQLEIEALMEDAVSDIQINAIQRSVVRTKILVTDIETLYREWEQSGKSRRDALIRRIIQRKYIQKEQLNDIAQIERISKGQALELLNIGVSELASRFFGIDGFHYAG